MDLSKAAELGELGALTVATIEQCTGCGKTFREECTPLTRAEQYAMERDWNKVKRNNQVWAVWHSEQASRYPWRYDL